VLGTDTVPVGRARVVVGRKQIATAPHTTDVVRCDRLWEESARLVGLPTDLSAEKGEAAER
jgi:hypothetical protein